MQKMCQIIALKMHSLQNAHAQWAVSTLAKHAESSKRCCILPVVVTPHPQKSVDIRECIISSYLILNAVRKLQSSGSTLSEDSLSEPRCLEPCLTEARGAAPINVIDMIMVNPLISKEYKYARKTNTGNTSHLFKANWCRLNQRKSLTYYPRSCSELKH